MSVDYLRVDDTVGEERRLSVERIRRLVVIAVVLALSGCSSGTPMAWVRPEPSATASSGLTPLPSHAPRPSQTPKPKPKPTPRKTLKATTHTGGDIGNPGTRATPPPSDGVPTHGAGTFSVAPGGTAVVGTGTTLVSYRVEVEAGIAWGTNPVWTPDGFAAAVDGILADPSGWIKSGDAPVTDAAQHMKSASWSFQRVSGGTYSVRLLLATPNTVDKLCGSVGLVTQGIYSCRYGKTILINLRRWLKGAPGFAIDLTGYHTMVVNHEMGHLLGFAHMLCPGAGKLAPVMQQQTIKLGGCKPNAFPFAPDGTFVEGPWAAS